MKPITQRSTCPVSSSLDIFGDKWTLLVLRDMIFWNKYSFSEFLTSEEKIATNILTDRLNALHAEGFVTKKPSPENRSKYLYKMTEKAIDLVPVLVEYVIWGMKHTQSKVPGDLITRISKNKLKVIKELQEKLREESTM